MISHKASWTLSIFGIIVISHFLISNYIVCKVGTTAGQHCVARIKEQSKTSKDQNNGERISNEEKHKISQADVYLLYALSFPVEPLLAYLLRPLHRNWLMEPLKAKAIDINVFQSRARILRYLSLGINSLVFGTVVIAIAKAAKTLRK
jgi:hypothetical protein